MSKEYGEGRPVANTEGGMGGTGATVYAPQPSKTSFLLFLGVIRTAYDHRQKVYLSAIFWGLKANFIRCFGIRPTSLDFIIFNSVAERNVDVML